MKRPNHWTKHFINMLGKRLDTEIASEMKISISAVTQKRRKLKIAAVRPRNQYRRWTQAELDLLGTEPDAIIGAYLTRKRKSVRTERNRRSISAVKTPLPHNIIKSHY